MRFCEATEYEVQVLVIDINDDCALSPCLVYFCIGVFFLRITSRRQHAIRRLARWQRQYDALILYGTQHNSRIYAVYMQFVQCTNPYAHNLHSHMCAARYLNTSASVGVLTFLRRRRLWRLYRRDKHVYRNAHACTRQVRVYRVSTRRTCMRENRLHY